METNVKKINLEEILQNNCSITLIGGDNPYSNEEFVSKKGLKQAMLEFGQQLLELAYEKSKIDILKFEDVENKGWYILNDKNRLVKDQLNDLYCYSISKQSILDTINQVEP